MVCCLSQAWYFADSTTTIARIVVADAAEFGTNQLVGAFLVRRNDRVGFKSGTASL